MDTYPMLNNPLGDTVDPKSQGRNCMRVYFQTKIGVKWSSGAWMSCTSTSRAILNAAANSLYIIRSPPPPIWWVYPKQNSGSYSESLCVAHALKNYSWFIWHSRFSQASHILNSHSLRNTVQVAPLQFSLPFLKSPVASVRYCSCYVGKRRKDFGKLGNPQGSVNFGRRRSGRTPGHVGVPVS